MRSRKSNSYGRYIIVLAIVIFAGYMTVCYADENTADTSEKLRNEDIVIEDESTMEEIDYRTLMGMENENQTTNAADSGNCDADSYEMVEENNTAYLTELQNQELQKQMENENNAQLELAKLNDVDYLRQKYFQCDSTTTIDSSEINAEKLLGMDMSVDKNTDAPTILIYHTHSQEGYVDSVEGDLSTTVVGLGEYLAQLLREKYGFNVLHHEGVYDKGDRDHAYSNSLPYIEQLMKDNPSIQLVIDLHRDGVGENTRLVSNVNGTEMAPIMFFCGLSRTTALGNIDRLPNPYIENNLALAFQMQVAANQTYPGLTRRIYLKGYRYNQHICSKCMLVEVGAQTNTLQEARNSMLPLADLINQVLSKQ